MEVAREAEYFYKKVIKSYIAIFWIIVKSIPFTYKNSPLQQQQEQLKKLKADHISQADYHQKQIEEHEAALKKHKEALAHAKK